MRAVGGRQKAEGRGGKLWARWRHLRSACCLLAAGFCLTGCSGSNRDPADQRSEKTLRDPMGYSPGFEKADGSGEGLFDYDRDGMRKDLKNVFDP